MRAQLGLVSAAALAVFAAAGGVRAQTGAQPPAGGDDSQGSGQPPSVGYPEPSPAGPAQSPPPAAAPAGQAPGQAPPAASPQEPPPPASAGQPPPAAYSQDGYGYAYGEPPPPPPPKEPGSFPAFSVRIDPINALLKGRMGLELEMQLWKFITAEVAPVFVVWQQPPLIYWVGRNNNLRQESNGLGPISGASIAASFWLEGKPFRGFVLKAILTDYGYRYVAKDNVGLIDQSNQVERRLLAFFGSYSKIGFFTYGGGIELGVELNRRRRCIATHATASLPAVAGTNCPNESVMQVERFGDANNPTDADFRGFPFPVVLDFRLSLGFVFEP
jgi:hypothetical protein